MPQRISYNKAKELASHIEGAELVTYENGNVAIRFNAISGNDPDKPMEPITIYNKQTVNFDEAKQLFHEKHDFKVTKSTLEAFNSEATYAVYSQECLMHLYDKATNLWSTIKPTDRKDYMALDKPKQRAFKAHQARIEEWLRDELPATQPDSEPESIPANNEEYTVADFGL